MKKSNPPVSVKKLLICSFLLALLPSLFGCTANQSNSYEKALAFFADGDYSNAAEVFERLSGYAQADTYAAYCHGLLLYDAEDYAGAETYFEKTQGFMNGTARYRYCKAMRLCSEGNYSEAKHFFETISDFEDSQEQAAYCDACLASDEGDYERMLISLESAGKVRDAGDQLLNLQMYLYNLAIQKKESNEYEQAIAIFNLLGDYLTSAEQAVSCKELLREEEYLHAEELLSQGDTEGAYETFNSLGSYRDSAQRSEELAEILGLDH